MASRATLMTGMYENKTGCNFSHGAMTPDKFELSYPMLLKGAGYKVGFAGKFGYAIKKVRQLKDVLIILMKICLSISLIGGEAGLVKVIMLLLKISI
ncbi:hypothetical protein K4L44_17065 [Halosquirtibacter laminarini]|uniref:Uncharacterized protein n=2 Tax=Halosquirtibacter laminarini TaxID=3374600 RepID=A0AC61NF18_9BACT|nr:hypothetical protein K4L44_17065 [Prolixibacteraceae bacterium]